MLDDVDLTQIGSLDSANNNQCKIMELGSGDIEVRVSYTDDFS